MSCTYIIKTKTDITQAMVDVCQESSLETLFPSVDGLLAVLKWEGVDPVMFSGDTKYTHTQIRVEMVKVEWTPLLSI